MKILVADANEAFRLLLCNKLEALGHQVTVVDNGIAAARELKRDRYSVLLSD